MRRKEIKAGSYVVVLYDKSTINNWTNYCLKQRIDCVDIRPISSPKMPEASDENYRVEFEYWRYATPEEIAKYNEIGVYMITEVDLVTEINNYQIF